MEAYRDVTWLYVVKGLNSRKIKSNAITRIAVYYRRDVTDEVKSAMVALRSAETKTCEKARARGVCGSDPLKGELSVDGPMPDCSLSAAACALAGWQPNSPPQLAAEFFMCGMFDSLAPFARLHNCYQLYHSIKLVFYL